MRPTFLKCFLLETVAAVYATGQTWAEMKRLWTCGLKAYMEDMWNMVEFATTSLYITTYTLKFVSFFLVCSQNAY